MDPKPTVENGPRVVLVADDDDAIRTLITRSLTILPCTVYEAADGIQARDILDKIPIPKLVVLDVMMPRVDGLQLAGWMRSQPRLTAVPILFLTANAHPLDVVRGINAGARHYLTKPFRMAEFIQKARRALGIEAT